MSDLSASPLPVPPGPSTGSFKCLSQSLPFSSRDAPNARLANSITFVGPRSSIATVHGPDRRTSGQFAAWQTPTAGSPPTIPRGPGGSALARALSASVGKSPPCTLTDLLGTGTSAPTGALAATPGSTTNDDSVGPSLARTKGEYNSYKSYEDFDIVRRHLAGPVNALPFGPGGTTTGLLSVRGKAAQYSESADAYNGTVSRTTLSDEDGFSSLRMQGGDTTREIYRRTEAETVEPRGKLQRSRSLYILHKGPASEELDIKNIREPGGFRRNHMRRTAQSSVRSPSDSSRLLLPATGPPMNILTRNFYEFLSLYGHFAGEDIGDEEDDSEDNEFQVNATQDNDVDDDVGEDTGEEGTLVRGADSKRRRKDSRGPRTGTSGTILLLLKSFVGTGVLFLPRAFLNGGMLFSFLVLLSISLISYYCFVLLTKSRLILKGSFAEMGEMTHGKYMRALINLSLVLSQVGFASAYIVFTSENLQAFVLAVSDCKTYIDIKVMILMQLILFLPLSLYRNLNNISHVIYIADVFIVAGLVYLYYYGTRTLVANHGVADIVLFNRSGWTIFIGTAIFTFEGIGLILPIEDGMKKPQQLPAILGGVMVIITLIFVSMGALSYAAYGSETETVIILNMPQDSKFVNAVQFIYSLAILLSTPMQIFPAITIMENGIFTKSGKYSKNIKWQKNGFRFLVVMVSALIAWVGANDLDKFVALVGSFACIPLVYIYPVSLIDNLLPICLSEYWLG